ncbi:MAG: prepilin peptidase [Alphaproteobacteria bacterium]|nr:prepilin peptidase [Alphaproteobacteria bacterium]
MSSAALDTRAAVLPPLLLHAEAKEPGTGWARRVEGVASGLARSLAMPLAVAGRARFVRQVFAAGSAFAGVADAELLVAHVELRRRLRRERLGDEAAAQAFALVREVAWRRIGQRHHDTQVMGGHVVLRGAVAEIETGEGKTLTATLPAAAAALSGIPVHVVTVNDYLARRDRDAMAPVYEAVGLSVGLVVEGMTPAQRRAAYRCDIVYCTNKEVAFDHLRDRILLGQVRSNLRMKLDRLQRDAEDHRQPVMRGLHFAIVDEADSVLVDEARTPLIISQRSDPADERRRAEQALAIVEGLDAGQHYRLLRDLGQVEITEAGRHVLEARAAALDGPWQGAIHREEQARNALAALHLFRRDEHYLVRDRRIEIIDEYTGRVMRDRSWGEGLHQIIEAKEGCEVTGRTLPAGRMTFQRFFRRYRRLAGMTGTAREAAHELWQVYRLEVVRIPTHRKLRRRAGGTRIFRTADAKWRAVVERVRALNARGVPVLVGTRSVASSELVSARLQAAGLAHVVLNAAQDAHEAEIVAEAGRPGHITVATNMAGRGVDIRLGASVAGKGGLHVIMTESHDDRRIDRQLFGRCARQGDPGHVESMLSLEDPVLEAVPRLPLPGRLRLALAQRGIERRHARMRRDLLVADERQATALAFAGRPE